MAKRNKPRISVLMGVYNGAEMLDSTIKSVLEQSMDDFEFIAVNDGSKDRSLEILKKYAKKDKRLVIIDKSNTGLTKSLNAGLKKAKGKYIARIDAGDLCKKDRLKIQSNFLDKNPKVALVGSWVELIDTNGKKIGHTEYPVSDEDIKNGLQKANVFAHSTWMIRKSVLDKEGFYDEKFKCSQDYELITRIRDKYKFYNLKKKLVSYMFDPKGITFARGKDSKKFLLLAQKKNGIVNKSKISIMEAIVPAKVKLFAITILKFITFNILKKDLILNFNGRKMVLERK